MGFHGSYKLSMRKYRISDVIQAFHEQLWAFTGHNKTFTDYASFQRAYRFSTISFRLSRVEDRLYTFNRSPTHWTSPRVRQPPRTRPTHTHMPAGKEQHIPKPAAHHAHQAFRQITPSDGTSSHPSTLPGPLSRLLQ